MPYVISWLITALIGAAGSILGRVLIGLGLGFVEYMGLQALVDSVLSQATSMITSSAVAGVAEWMGFWRIDQHFTIWVSAISVKLLLNSMSGGSFKKLVSK